MIITAQTLMQARESLIAAGHKQVMLMQQIKDQARRIAELEREIQQQVNARAQVEQTLAEVQADLEATKAQLPDESTEQAFEWLVQFLAAPAEHMGKMRVAA
jgi:septal ring factor EnvC (AmiA/AmiB activator)